MTQVFRTTLASYTAQRMQAELDLDRQIKDAIARFKAEGKHVEVHGDEIFVTDKKEVA